MMADLIDRQAVQEMVDRIGDIHPYRQIGNRESYSQYNEAWTDAINRVDAELNSLPSADIDLSGFSDRLWKTAYERGKADAVRHGHWLRTGRTNVYGGFEVECSVCNDNVMITNIEYEHYCRNCGARMDEGSE